IVCSPDERRKYWPGRKSLWEDSEHPDGGFGRGYDKNGSWKGNELKDSTIYILKNTGTNEKPIFQTCEEIYSFSSMDHIVDAIPVDVDGDGKLELLIRMNIDGLYMLKLNDDLKPEGTPVEMKCSPLKRAHYETSFFPCDINKDGKVDILVSGNPGVVFWLENTGEHLVERPPLLKHGGDVKAETLSVPCFADMDNDGHMELIVGDSSGYLWYFDNHDDEANKYIDKTNRYIFKAGKRMKANGKEIHHQAGYSGSIQGPAEKRWGYTNPLTVDWDEDGLIDIIVNDITGKIKWYRNIGTKNRPEFNEAKTLMCNGKEFVAAWRSRPAMWGSNMLVVINIDGFTQFFIKDEKDCSIVHEGNLLRYIDGCAIRCCGPGGHLGRTVLFTCDWDNDGVMDIVGGTHRDLTRHINAFFPRKSTVFWLKNIGTNSMPVFERPRLITFKDGSPIDFVCHKCSPWCIDMDGDGELDLALGAEDGKVYTWLRKELKWDWEPSKDFSDVED
ncbi:MAG: VCBS repeat-containing protein, partial [Clostridiaceae bacterium]|nr:VCBS repeat-containing protein [Clostridiaceae bacterium]